jgi:hypothetical protein
MSTITEEQLAATIASTIESILKTKGLIPLDKSQQVMSPSGPSQDVSSEGKIDDESKVSTKSRGVIKTVVINRVPRVTELMAGLERQVPLPTLTKNTDFESWKYRFLS